MAFSLTGSIASFLHFRQARFDGADEKRHRLLNCEATRLPYWRRRPAPRKWRRKTVRNLEARLEMAGFDGTRTSEETMFLQQVCIIVPPANVYYI
jgi:hypothetical protein